MALSKIFTRKKAALALLRVYRLAPDCIDLVEWPQKLSSYMDSRDVGLLTSVMSLVVGFAKARPALFENLMEQVRVEAYIYYIIYTNPNHNPDTSLRLLLCCIGC